LPNISPNSVTEALKVTDFLSEEVPNKTMDVQHLRELPIPGRANLEQIHQYLLHLDKQNYCSVTYAHLPQGTRLTQLPKWVLVYWVEVFLLRKHVLKVGILLQGGCRIHNYNYFPYVLLI
jgi:hypothetical protein